MSQVNLEDIYKNNSKLWDGLAKINAKSSFYNVKSFKDVKTSLNRVECEELGSVDGKSLLHLQCHFGLDTLSWARKGAKVTGVDFSNEAISMAKGLSDELNIPAQFICSDIYNLPVVCKEKFDIVFTSYGVLVWLFNLNKWAEVVAAMLKPGGTFYIVEFHPFTNVLDDEWKEIGGSYFNGEIPLCLEQSGSYADNEALFNHVSYEWPHTLGETITALRRVGIIVETFNEFPFSSYNCFPNLEESSPGEFTLIGHKNTLPLMFSLKATYIPELASIVNKSM